MKPESMVKISVWAQIKQSLTHTLLEYTCLIITLELMVTNSIEMIREYIANLIKTIPNVSLMAVVMILPSIFLI